MKIDRRDLIAGISGLSAALILSGCGKGDGSSSKTEASADQNAKGGEVTATEDLMREHGILRRALLIYSEAAVKLRSNAANVPPDSLQRTAKLFRAFGEDYHEKKLEEAYIFPAVKQAGGAASALTDILLAQHQRGREITDYILSVTEGAKLGQSNSEPLSRAMESLVRMYRAHAAREDTVIFPAWKKTMTAKQLDEMGDKFEEIEHEQFGEDGFEDAARQIAAIEESMGLADLSRFTASWRQT